MRDFELDDRFWRDALSVLHAGGRADALAERYPDYAGLLDELALDAAEEPVLDRLSPRGRGREPAPLALLSAALLAHADGARSSSTWIPRSLARAGPGCRLQGGGRRPPAVRRAARALRAADGLRGIGGDERRCGLPRGLATRRSAPLPRRAPFAQGGTRRGGRRPAAAGRERRRLRRPRLCDAVVTIEDTEGPSEPLGTERGVRPPVGGSPRRARAGAPLPPVRGSAAGGCGRAESLSASPAGTAIAAPARPARALLGRGGAARAERTAPARADGPPRPSPRSSTS